MASYWAKNSVEALMESTSKVPKSDLQRPFSLFSHLNFIAPLLILLRVHPVSLKDITQVYCSLSTWPAWGSSCMIVTRYG